MSTPLVMFKAANKIHKIITWYELRTFAPSTSDTMRLLIILPLVVRTVSVTQGRHFNCRLDDLSLCEDAT